MIDHRGFTHTWGIAVLPVMVGLMYLAAPSKLEEQDLQKRRALSISVLEKAMGSDLDFSPRERVDLARALGCEVTPPYQIGFHIPQNANASFYVDNGDDRCYVSDQQLENYQQASKRE